MIISAGGSRSGFAVANGIVATNYHVKTPIQLAWRLSKTSFST